MCSKRLFFGFIKPDSMDKQNEIIEYFREAGMVLLHKEKVIADSAKLSEHYKEHEGKSFYNDMISEIKDREILLFVLKGDENIVVEARNIIKEKIRPLYSKSISMNACHGSDSDESVQRECNIWFGQEKTSFFLRVSK